MDVLMEHSLCWIWKGRPLVDLSYCHKIRGWFFLCVILSYISSFYQDYCRTVEILQDLLTYFIPTVTVSNVSYLSTYISLSLCTTELPLILKFVLQPIMGTRADYEWLTPLASSPQFSIRWTKICFINLIKNPY